MQKAAKRQLSAGVEQELEQPDSLSQSHNRQAWDHMSHGTAPSSKYDELTKVASCNGFCLRACYHAQLAAHAESCSAVRRAAPCSRHSLGGRHTLRKMLGPRIWPMLQILTAFDHDSMPPAVDQAGIPEDR